MLLIALFSLVLSPSARADNRVVELLTFEPGDSVWSRFGHIGLRVTDPEQKRDVVYDYGHALFEDATFFIDYLRGDCRFYLAVRPYGKVVDRYREYNRTIVRQRLNLSDAQKTRLIERLEWESQPENRAYVYDQLQDNCSTRLRDVLNEVTGGALQRAAELHTPEETYRDYTLHYGAGCLAAQLGIDLLAGPNHDLALDAWGDLYLPLNLQRTVGEAQNEVDGQVVPLAQKPIVEFEREGPPPLSGKPYFGRYLAFFFCLLLGVFFVICSRAARLIQGKAGRVLKRIVGLVLVPVGLLFGLVGGLILFLVITSSVPDYGWNHNVFVFVPLDVVFVVTGVRWLILGRDWVTPLFRWYVLARLSVLGLVAADKLLGIMAYQDNGVFMASVAVLLTGLVLGMPVKPKRGS